MAKLSRFESREGAMLKSPPRLSDLMLFTKCIVCSISNICATFHNRTFHEADIYGYNEKKTLVPQAYFFKKGSHFIR